VNAGASLDGGLAAASPSSCGVRLCGVDNAPAVAPPAFAHIVRTEREIKDEIRVLFGAIGTSSPAATLQVSGNNSQLRLHDTGRGNFWSLYTENHPNAAIQELNRKLEEKLRARDAAVEELKARVEKLERALEHRRNGNAK